MPGNYKNHSKVVCCNYDEIQDHINNENLDAWDVVYTYDTHENILITDDLSLISIQSKVYRYIDIESAEIELNSNPDTYEGQIVSIIYKGSYVGYIVNKKNGKFYVSPLSVYSGEVNYDTLGRRPIENVEGTIDNPVTLDTLDNGIYKIVGQYKITASDETTYLSMNSNLFFVEKDSENSMVYIKKISASDICDYIINGKKKIITSVVPTTEWLQKQGYVTESYVDQKIAALDFITKDEVENYVQNIVLQSIEQYVDEQIDIKFDEKFESATELELLNMFTKK